jgi:mRNA interferase MazF
MERVGGSSRIAWNLETVLTVAVSRRWRVGGGYRYLHEEYEKEDGTEPAGMRPAVVLQHDRFNRSRLATAVVVAVASNLRYAALPGNVRLRKGEGGLSVLSVVNVTQIATVDRAHLRSRLGQLGR